MEENTPSKLSLSQLSLYNPSRMSDEEIILSFAARQRMFERILADLSGEKKNSISQHHLIVGQRGMGKSTLLGRIAAELRTQKSYKEIFIPLVFAEEQYAVDRLSRFWLNCLDSLADACEREEKMEEVDRIDDLVNTLTSEMGSSNSNEVAAATSTLEAFLASAGRLKRRPVLFVDNLQLVFERISKQQQHVLREFLLRPGAPILIGASPSPPPESQDYGAAFYDHFKTHYLPPLSVEEMKNLMLALAERVERPDVRERVLKYPHRLQVLHQLTGGNPRTTVTLFFLYAEDFAPSVFGDLENLLDRVTPLYKARFEELSDQQQVIASAVANHWDPVTVKELSQTTGLKTTGLSGQLDRMEKTGFIERVGLAGKSSKGVQIAERFFNIWFLMRSASRRQRREVEFLARFIESFYETEDRCRLAKLIQTERDLSPDRHLFVQALSYTLEGGEARDLNRHAQLDALRKREANIRRRLEEVIDFKNFDPVVVAFSVLKERLAKLVPSDASIKPTNFVDKVLESRQLFKTGDRERLANRPVFQSKECSEFVELLDEMKEDEKQQWGEESAQWFSNRLTSGQLADRMNLAEWESAFIKAPNTVVTEMLLESCPPNLGKMTNHLALENIENLLKPDEQSPGSQWFHWAIFSHTLVDQLDRAVSAYRKAIKKDPSNVPSRNNFAILLETELRDFSGAEQVYRDAIASKFSDANLERGLAALLHRHLNRPEEAEKILRNLIDENRSDAAAWNRLGEVLRDRNGELENAVSAFMRALELEEENVEVWNNLGWTFGHQLGRFEKAEKAFKTALEIDPRSVSSWTCLGNLLCDQKQEFEEASKAFEEALKIEPGNEAVMHNVVFLRRDFLGEGVKARPIFKKFQPRLKGAEFKDVLHLQEALFQAYVENWGYAREALISALSYVEGGFTRWTEDDWMRASAVLLHLGYGKQFLELLVELGKNRRFRPWYEALKSLHALERGELKNIAPEVRVTAEVYFDKIQKRLNALPEGTRKK